MTVSFFKFVHSNYPRSPLLIMNYRLALPTQKALFSLTPGKRPASITELVDQANLDEWIGAHTNLTLKGCIKATSDLINVGNRLETEDLIESYNGQVDEGLLEERFVQLVRVAALVLEVLPRYPEYNEIVDVNQRGDFETVRL